MDITAHRGYQGRGSSYRGIFLSTVYEFYILYVFLPICLYTSGFSWVQFLDRCDTWHVD